MVAQTIIIMNTVVFNMLMICISVRLPHSFCRACMPAKPWTTVNLISFDYFTQQLPSAIQTKSVNISVIKIRNEELQDFTNSVDGQWLIHFDFGCKFHFPFYCPATKHFRFSIHKISAHNECGCCRSLSQSAISKFMFG